MTETRAKSFLAGMGRRAVESLGDTVASLPPREATLVKLPDLLPELSEALRKMGASRLYSHQLEAYERVLAGENVVVATATASGKSLCYKIPAFQNALGRAKSRAIFLYPTKALAQDQLGKINAFDLRGVHPATYDGDTPHALRADIRRRANILLTNPDMLNIGILPNHEPWADYLRNLEIVAVDEAHVLRGVFGSHVAAVLRRLRRVAMLHGGDPRFVLTSATIANPQELAESLTGLPFTLVDSDGASTGERRVIFRNPPLLDKEKGERRSLLTEGALVFANLVSQGVRTIAFARTRKAAELIYRYAADRLGVDGARWSSGLTSGRWMPWSAADTRAASPPYGSSGAAPDAAKTPPSSCTFLAGTLSTSSSSRTRRGSSAGGWRRPGSRWRTLTYSARTCSPPPTRPRSTRMTRSTSGLPTGAWRRR